MLVVHECNADAKQSLLGQEYSCKLALLEKELNESKESLKQYKESTTESVAMLVGGWCQRDDKSLLSIFFNRWVRYYLKERGNFERVEFPPPPMPENGEIPSSSTARGGLVSYTKTLELENANLKQKLEASVRGKAGRKLQDHLKCLQVGLHYVI